MRLQTEYFDSPLIAGRVLDWTIGGSSSQKQALFFIHGGGWRGGSRTHFHRLMEWFGERGFVSGSTDYRLSDVQIVEQLQDVRRGYHLFKQKLVENGGPESIVVLGSSAGAHLALLLSMTLPGECGEPMDPDVAASWERPDAVVVQAAPTRFEEWPEIFPGIQASMRSIIGCTYQDNPQRWQAVSPIEHLSQATPACLFLEAANEHMFPHHYTLEFIEAAKKYGVTAQYIMYPNAEHGFLYDYQRPVQFKALQDILQFLAYYPRSMSEE